MKIKKIVIASLTALTLASGASAEPERPVIDAALQAQPAQRLEARRFVLQAYPGLRKDMYSQMKAQYPTLERGLTDAFLQTWTQHPGEMMAISAEVKEKYGPRMKAVRSSVLTELEASYPDFKNRLGAVLEEHGPASRWMRFVSDYDPTILPTVRAEVKKEFPEAEGWYPGKFRQMIRQAGPGENPVLDKLRGFVTKNPDFAPKLARKMVDLARARNPQMGEDLVKHMVDNRGSLREALKAEFPGAADKIVQVVTNTDPELRGEIGRFVRSRTVSQRADFRANLEAQLPGFEVSVERTLKSRYPQLQDQVLKILKG